MVVIDTDIFILEFAFHNDSRQAINIEFLKRVQSAEPAITLYNLMEILGQLSFNLAPAKLDDWQSWLVDAYTLTVIWPFDLDEPLPAAVFFRKEIFDQPFTRMRQKRMAFLDSLVLNLAERTPDVEFFVTWNAKHFKNKSSIAVLTPDEFLKTAS